MTAAPDLQRLGDGVEIDALLTRYCYAIDARNWAGYRAMFTADAHVDYSAAGLPEGTVDDVVDFLDRQQGSFAVGMHYVTNIEVTDSESQVGGDGAQVVAMWFNAVRLPGAEDMRFFSGRWHDELVRTPAGWRIRDLRLEVLG